MTRGKIRGINFTIFSFTFFSLLLVNFIGMTVLSNRVNSEYDNVKKSVENYIACNNASETITEVSRYMTEQAQLFIMTHEEKYAKAYLKEKFTDRRQEEAISNLMKVMPAEDTSSQRLLIALQQSESLSSIEMYAMRLTYHAMGERNMPEEFRRIEIRDKDLREDLSQQQLIAERTIFGDGYLLYKKRVSENCQEITSRLGESLKVTMTEKSVKLQKYIDVLSRIQIILIVCTVIFFVCLVVLVLLPMKSFIQSIKKKERLSVAGSTEFQYLAKTYNEVHEYDPLTKILNRRAFMEVGNQLKGQNVSIALILVDVDNFKQINDSAGHSTGDRVLGTVAENLNKAFRKKDSVCRIGGDEFAVIVADAPEEISNTLEYKLKTVNEKLGELNLKQKVSISAGIAFSTEGYSQELFDRADKALYRAKIAKGTTCVF